MTISHNKLHQTRQMHLFLLCLLLAPLSLLQTKFSQLSNLCLLAKQQVLILLKELAVPISEPLADLFNFSIRSGKVPKLWEEDKISPIYKKDDPSIVSNYRPISLLNTFGKVLEKNCSQTCFQILQR